MDKGTQTEMTSELNTIWDVAMIQGREIQDTVNYELVRLENSGSQVTDSTNYKMWTSDLNSFYLLPSATLQVDCRLVKTVGGVDVPLTHSDHTVMASNGYCMFQDARLRINDVEVSHATYVGKMSHMRNMVESSPEYIKSVGETSHYYLDSTSDQSLTGTVTYVAPETVSTAVVTNQFTPTSFFDKIQKIYTGYQTALPAPNPLNYVADVRFNEKYDESFDKKITRVTSAVDASTNMKIVLPLRDIFPFLDLQKVVRGSRIELELNKVANDKSAIFGMTNVKLIIDRVAMWISRVKPSYAGLARLEAQLIKQPVIETNYEAVKMYMLPYSNVTQGDQNWVISNKAQRPTKVVIGFQYNNRDTDHRLNPLQFDFLPISRIALMHNGTTVPNTAYLPQYDHSRIVKELHRIGYKEGDISDSSCVTVENWKKTNCLYGFSLENVEGQPYESRNSSHLELHWTTGAVPSGYNVFALVYSEASAFLDYSSGVTTVKTS